MRALLVTLALAAAAGCYAPDVPPCTISCTQGGVACPAELTCSGDGYCHDVGDPTVCATTTLSITTNGAGSGRVESAPAGVDCTSDSSGAGCDAVRFPIGTMIELTETPNGTDHFDGWTGDACAGTTTATCAFMLAKPTLVNAKFD